MSFLPVDVADVRVAADGYSRSIVAISRQVSATDD
jgi:hypothetical protein